ncbi:C2 domain-containing protein [Baffinella frigidus]|nr:C2 domain-containing protein [Cryptophyta sp. CCMP2293]
MLNLYEGIAGGAVGRAQENGADGKDGEGASPALLKITDGKDGEGASPALLKITVMRGRDLLAKDRGGTSDPYVRVHIGDELLKARKTGVKDKTLNPTWMEEFEFTISSSQRQEHLVIEAFDKDTFGTDDTLGKFGIPLDTLAPDREYRDWPRLEDKDTFGTDGTLGKFGIPLDTLAPDREYRDWYGFDASADEEETNRGQLELKITLSELVQGV